MERKHLTMSQFRRMAIQLGYEKTIHGIWTTNSDMPDTLICSICGCGYDMWKHDSHDYCPHCGAKMDGGKESDD